MCLNGDLIFLFKHCSSCPRNIKDGAFIKCFWKWGGQRARIVFCTNWKFGNPSCGKLNNTSLSWSFVERFWAIMPYQWINFNIRRMVSSGIGLSMNSICYRPVLFAAGVWPVVFLTKTNPGMNGWLNHLWFIATTSPASVVVLSSAANSVRWVRILSYTIARLVLK